MTNSSKSSESLSVGIVTYNNAKLIGSTIESVISGLPCDIQSSVVVLDNQSTDNTLEIARQAAAKDSRVQVILNDSNSGFGSGHNTILALVETDYHIICNPDITLTGNAIETLVHFLRSNNEVAIACPRVHFPDGRLQPLNRRRATIFDLFLRRFLPRLLQKFFKARMDRYNMLDVGYDHSYAVPIVSGAFMACRTLPLKEVCGFDERYFLYFEDADLSRSIQERGWGTYYCPEALVIHEWQREAHKSIKGALIFSQSAFRYFNKWGWKLF